MMRWTSIIGASLLALVLSGCSALRTGYNNAPTLTYYWLDGYLDLDSRQSTVLREGLKSLHEWHRKEELPLIAQTLSGLQSAAANAISTNEVCRVYDGLRERATAPMERLAPLMAKLATTMSPAQLAHLATQYEKRNAEWREEWLDPSPAQRNERRSKQLQERAEGFYGDLSDAQRGWIQSQIESGGFDPAVQHRETQRRQQDSLRTLALLRSGTLSEAQALAEMQALIGRSLLSPDASYRRYREQIREATCAAIAGLHNSSTPLQREKMAQTLNAYASDARALAAAR
jgi:hypothetical protein